MGRFFSVGRLTGSGFIRGVNDFVFYVIEILLPLRVSNPLILVCKVQLQVINFFMSNLPKIMHDYHVMYTLQDRNCISSYKTSSFLD